MAGSDDMLIIKFLRKLLPSWIVVWLTAGRSWQVAVAFDRDRAVTPPADGENDVEELRHCQDDREGLHGALPKNNADIYINVS